MSFTNGFLFMLGVVLTLIGVGIISRRPADDVDDHTTVSGGGEGGDKERCAIYQPFVGHCLVSVVLFCAPALPSQVLLCRRHIMRSIHAPRLPFHPPAPSPSQPWTCGWRVVRVGPFRRVPVLFPVAVVVLRRPGRGHQPPHGRPGAAARRVGRARRGTTSGSLTGRGRASLWRAVPSWAAPVVFLGRYLVIDVLRVGRWRGSGVET